MKENKIKVSKVIQEQQPEEYAYSVIILYNFNSAMRLFIKLSMITVLD